MGIFHVDNFSGGSDRSVMAIGHSYQLGQRTIIKGMQNLRFEKVEFFCKLAHLQNNKTQFDAFIG